MPTPSPPPGRTATVEELDHWMARFEDELARWDRGILVAQWGVALERKGARPETWELGRARLLRRPGLLRLTEEALRRPLPLLLHRRYELLHRAVEDVAVEHRPPIVLLRNRLLRRAAGLRIRVGKKRYTGSSAWDFLHKSPDRTERKAVWSALQAASRPLEPGIRDLARMRNEAAREHGYRTFADLRLSQEGITRPQLERWIRKLNTFGRPAHRKLRRDFETRTGASDWYPWDNIHAEHASRPDLDRYFPARTMLASTFRGLKGWGFDPRQRGIKIVLHSNPYAGLTYAPTIPSDVRVLAFPLDGLGWTSVLLHEMGHALHHASTRVPYHLLRGYETLPGSAGLAEGIGGTFEEITSMTGFLRTQPGLPAEVLPAYQAARGENIARAASHTGNWVAKELELYKDPDRDLDALYTRMERDLRGFDPSPTWSWGDGMWAQFGFYGKAYLLAWMFSAQVLEAALRELGGEDWPNWEMAPWLVKNLFRDGVTHEWVPHVREITGRPFGPEALLRRARNLSP